MSVTAKDIAKIVGVSRTAVSAVLNGHVNKVAREKREKIFAVANDLRYRPSATALSLAGKPTLTVGLIFSPNISPIYAELIKHLPFLLREKGYECELLLPTDAKDELEVLRECRSRGADGAIVAYAINDVKNLPSDLPMVSLSPYPGQYEVRVDLCGGFQDAVRHLIEVHGHRRIGMVCPSRSVVPLQIEGYEDALRTAGIRPEKSWVLEVTGAKDAGEKLNTMIHRDKITAWAVTNDLLAARFINFLSHEGIRVPENAAIVSFDGNAWGCELPCPLTSLVFPASAIAQRCVDELLLKIKNGATPMQKPTLIRPKLFLGGSCGCPRHRSGKLYWSGQPLTLDSVGEPGGGFDPEDSFTFQ